jgi:hypothetical protein
VTDEPSPVPAVPRRRITGAALLVAIAAALVIGVGALLVASRHRATDEPATDTLALGRSAVIRGGAGDEARVTVRSATVRRTACDNLGPESVKGEYLVADVTVTVLKGTWSVDPYDFFYDAPLTGSLAASVTTAFGAFGDGCGSDLAAGTFKAGETSSGHVFFHRAAIDGDISYVLRTVARSVSWKLG